MGRRRPLALLLLAAAGRCFVGLGGRTARRAPRRAEPRHQLGDIVEVRCEDDAQWYQAIIEHENPDGGFMVRFDKEGYEYHYPLTAWRVPKARHFIAELEEGEMLNGRITDISSSGFYVDVGAEDEGFVQSSELEEGTRISELRVGQEVTVRVLSASEKLVLSMRPVGETTGVAAFRDVPPDMVLRATISETLTFGAFAMVQPPQGGQPCRGLIHISNMGRGFVRSVEEEVTVGQEVLVSVISTKDDRLGLQLAREKESLSLVLEEGVWMPGQVAKVMSYGAFVTVWVQNQSLTGLLHVSEMDCFVVNALEHLAVGDNVTVRLLNQKKGRVSWSCSTQLTRYGDLEAFEPLVRSGAFVKGLVQSVEENGALILLQPPLGGMAVLGVLRRGDVEVPEGQGVEDVIAEGQEVDVRVVSTTAGRLLLSMVPLQQPVPKAFMDVGPELFLKGVVKELRDFGAFVDVQAPTEEAEYRGLVHISDVKEGFVAKITDELQVGQKVAVRIQGIEGPRMSLSMRPLERKRKAKPFANVSEEVDAEVQEILPYGLQVKVMDPNTGEEHLAKVHVADLVDGFGAVPNGTTTLRLRPLGGLSFTARRPQVVDVTVPDELNGTVAYVDQGYALVNVSVADNFTMLGYLHQSEMSHEEIFRLNASGELCAGEEVSLRKLYLCGDRLALTMRSPMSKEQSADFVQDEKLRGVVHEVTPLGAHVRLQPSGGGAAARGLVPMPWLPVDAAPHPGDALQVVVAAKGPRLLLRPA